MKQAIIITSIEEASEWMMHKDFVPTNVEKQRTFYEYGYVDNGKDGELLILYQLDKKIETRLVSGDDFDFECDAMKKALDETYKKFPWIKR